MYLENASGATADRPELLRLLKDTRKDERSADGIDGPPFPSSGGGLAKAQGNDRLQGPAHRRARPTDQPPGNAGHKGRRVHRAGAGRLQLNAGGDDGSYARKDYEQRSDRQAQGIEKAKAVGKCQGRPADADLHTRITELLRAGLAIRATARHANCSTTTMLRICDLSTV